MPTVRFWNYARYGASSVTSTQATIDPSTSGQWSSGEFVLLGQPGAGAFLFEGASGVWDEAIQSIQAWALVTCSHLPSFPCCPYDTPPACQAVSPRPDVMSLAAFGSSALAYGVLGQGPIQGAPSPDFQVFGPQNFGGDEAVCCWVN